MTRPYTSSERGDPELFRPEWTDRRGDYVFANSSRWPSPRAVASDVPVGNSLWRLYLEPEAGWRPAWERGVLAAVALASALMAALVGVIMASWAQQRHLLDEVMDRNGRLADTTAKLQDEKLRLDALLVRQYNLIAVLGGPRDGKHGEGGGGRGGRGGKHGEGGGEKGSGGGGGGEKSSGEDGSEVSFGGSKEGLTLGASRGLPACCLC